MQSAHVVPVDRPEESSERSEAEAKDGIVDSIDPEVKDEPCLSDAKVPVVVVKHEPGSKHCRCTKCKIKTRRKKRGGK